VNVSNLAGEILCRAWSLRLLRGNSRTLAQPRRLGADVGKT
jgi:hypothetical protein